MCKHSPLPASRAVTSLATLSLIHKICRKWGRPICACGLKKGLWETAIRHKRKVSNRERLAFVEGDTFHSRSLDKTRSHRISPGARPRWRRANDVQMHT